MCCDVGECRTVVSRMELGRSLYQMVQSVTSKQELHWIWKNTLSACPKRQRQPPGDVRYRWRHIDRRHPKVTQASKPRGKASQYHPWSCKAYGARKARCRILCRNPHSNSTPSYRAASVSGILGERWRRPREINKPQRLTPRLVDPCRVRRPRLLETEPPELYSRSRNTIIASWL